MNEHTKKCEDCNKIISKHLKKCWQCHYRDTGAVSREGFKCECGIDTTPFRANKKCEHTMNTEQMHTHIPIEFTSMSLELGKPETKPMPKMNSHERYLREHSNVGMDNETLRKMDFELSELYLLGKIDKALDENSKEDFLKHTAELKKLRESASLV